MKYELSGMTTGTKSIWRDYFGSKYRKEINSNQTVKTGKRTEVVKNHSLSISDGTYYYNVNMVTMEGTKIHKNAIPDFSLLDSGLIDGEMEQLGMGLLGALGGKVDKKSELVLGRTCDVTKSMGATVYVYKGVALRSYASLMGHEEREEAVSFEEDIRVDASKFTPPSNASIEDVSAEVSGVETFDEDREKEGGLLFPSGIALKNSETREIVYAVNGVIFLQCTTLRAVNTLLCGPKVRRMWH